MVFTTDNGGVHRYGGYNFPLRGEKHTLWEGGMRGISFVHGNMLGRRGVKCKELLHVTDWYPTLVNLVGTVHVSFSVFGRVCIQNDKQLKLSICVNKIDLHRRQFEMLCISMTSPVAITINYIILVLTRLLLLVTYSLSKKCMALHN